MPPLKNHLLNSDNEIITIRADIDINIFATVGLHLLLSGWPNIMEYGNKDNHDAITPTTNPETIPKY